MKVAILAPFNDKRSTIYGVLDGLRAGGHTWVEIETNKNALVKSHSYVNYVTSLAEGCDTTIIGKGTVIPLGVYTALVNALPDTTYLTFDSVSGNGCGPPGRPDEIGKRGLLCDRILLTGSEGARWFRNNGFKGRIAQIYQGCRHSLWRPQNLDAARTAQNMISFLGSANYKGDGGRRAKISGLAKAGFHVHHNKRTFHKDASTLYYNSGICLNMVCGTWGEGHTPVGLTSNRLVRLLTSGGFTLSERNTDVVASFEEGNQLVTFDFGDVPDLLEKAAYWMDKARAKERLEIARRGWEWSANWGWDQQIEKMIRFIDGDAVPADGAASPWVGTLRELGMADVKKDD